MKNKSNMKLGVTRYSLEGSLKIMLFLLIITLNINKGYSKQITLFEVKDQVEFAKFIDFTIKFSEMEDLKLADFFFEHSFISVIANVTLTEGCDKINSVNFYFT